MRGVRCPQPTNESNSRSGAAGAGTGATRPVTRRGLAGSAGAARINLSSLYTNYSSTLHHCEAPNQRKEKPVGCQSEYLD